MRIAALPTTSRTLSLALAVPLSLALAACGSGGETNTGTVEAQPVANVTPPAGQQWTDVVVATPEGGFRMGNPDASIKLVEYASLTCPACAQFSQTGGQPLKEQYVNSGRVSFELRNQIHGPHDLVLARLVRCGPEGSGIALSDQVFANQQAVLQPVFGNEAAFEQALQLPEDQRFVRAAEVGNFYDFFAARGLSEEQARQCLADFASLETIANNSQTQSDELGIEGTPTFLINGNNVGSLTWAQLEPMLQRAGAR